MEFANFFTKDELQRIHEASLEILENVGLVVHNEKARAIYKKHGCFVDDQTGLVKFPPKIVEECRQSFVPKYTFTARDPQYDRTLPDDGPVVVTASSAPNVIDPKTGIERRGTSTDIANIAHLINELPAFDVFSISVLADDAPKDQISLSRFYPALKNCKKPVRSNTPTIRDLEQVLELGYTIAGSKEAYMERPFINHHYCPVVSPLTMDVESTEAVIYLTEKGLPVYGTIVPNAGLTSPMSLLGTLTMGNAEFLALSCLIQMIRPGAPLIYAVLSTVADLRTGAYASGAIETGILQMGHTMMARYYNVPSGGYIGLTNAQVTDAQSGYETGMNITAALLAGADLFNMGGLLGGLMAFDFAKAVMDNEMALMLKHLKRGIKFSEEDLCLDLIKEIGPGGSYIEAMHTLENMRGVAFYPKVACREMRAQWLQSGQLNARDRALEEANKILSQPNPARFSDELDAKVRAHFPNLVKGDAIWE
ncbi:MAG TPA: trimethylamine methyltransferase [Clostridia bacterium]|jgi:trimethylamine--corrinoid protein Co-methyltransferase|nr:trimethylamine methyltransferase [Clostridia bacterium]